MGIGSIGSTQSFWQQDQNFWNQEQSSSSSLAATQSIINAIGSAETKLGKGLASIANQTALSRVNSQLTAAIQNLLSGGSTSGSTTGSSSSSTGSGTAASPAKGTGTAPLTVGTPLSTLGIPAGGSIVISAGGNTTTYASTGSDTVGDLISAINQDLVGNAAVTASLNKNGDLALTSKNTTDMISVGGVYAGNLGFAVGNDTFKPTKATSGATSSATTSSTSSTASSSKSSNASSSSKSYTTIASVTSSSAASLLSDSGVSGSLVNMLA